MTGVQTCALPIYGQRTEKDTWRKTCAEICHERGNPEDGSTKAATLITTQTHALTETELWKMNLQTS